MLEVLFGGAVGALLVFLLQIILEWWRRRNQLRGMSRLIHSEITHNNLTLRYYYEKPPRALSPGTSLLRLDTWESVRVQLSDMMPADTFGAVAYYYMFLQELKHVAATQEQFQNPASIAANLLKQLDLQERDASLASLVYANMGGAKGKGWAHSKYLEGHRKLEQSGEGDEKDKGSTDPPRQAHRRAHDGPGGAERPAG